MKLQSLIFFLILMLNHTLFCQTFWESMNGPNGGSFEDIVFNSSDHVFTGGWFSPEGIFRSTDEGDSWQLTNEGFSDFQVFTIAVNKDDHVFIGTNQQGLFRSTNNGESWEKLDGYSSPECWTLTFNDSGHIYAGDGDWGGIYKSINSGEEWSRISTLFALRVAVNDSGHIFASERSGGLHRSKDNGITWDTLYNDFMDMPVAAIVFDPNGYVYVGTGYYSRDKANGVYVSKDNGDSWEHVGLANITVFSLAITQDGDVFAGTRDGGIYLTSDGGQNWDEMNNGLMSKRIYRLRINHQGHIYAVSDAYGGIYKSTNKGISWAQIGLPKSYINSIIVNNDGDILTGTKSGIHRFFKDGTHWENLGLSEVTSVALANDGDIFAGTFADGVFRSEDKGSNWNSTILNADSGITIYEIKTWGKDTILAGTDYYLKLMTKKGDSIRTLSNGLSKQTAECITITPDFNIFVGSYGIDRSTDGGNSFHQVLSALSLSPNELTSSRENFIFTGGGSIHISEDGGENWSKVNTSSAYCILVNENEHIFAGTPDGVIFSNDYGVTWNELNEGLEGPTSRVLSLAIDEEGYLYAGTRGNGVYRSTQTVSSISEDRNYLINTFYLRQNYPNPFNPTTLIEFSIPYSANTSLKIFNTLGEEIKTIVNEKLQAGNHTFAFDGSGLASGVYFYKITSGSFQDIKKMILIK